MQLGNLTQGDTEVLQDEPARRVDVPLAELVEIVPAPAAHVHQHDRFRLAVEPVDEPLLDGVEARVDPRRPALVDPGHVQVKPLVVRRVFRQVREHVLVGLVRVLQGPVGDAALGLVAVLPLPLGKLG